MSSNACDKCQFDTEEYAPQIAENIGRQLSQIIQPVALIEAPKTGQGETILAEVDGGRDRTSRRKRQGTRSAVSGSGDADINASEKVDAAVNGSGDVHYSGGPKSVNKHKPKYSTFCDIKIK